MLKKKNSNCLFKNNMIIYGENSMEIGIYKKAARTKK